MDAVESQVGKGNSQEPKALPTREVVSALSDLLVFLKALRQHLIGPNGSIKAQAASEKSAIPVQLSDKIDATNLAEFEKILNDLGQLIPTGNAFDTQSEDRGNLDQAVPLNIEPAAVNEDPAAFKADLPVKTELPVKTNLLFKADLPVAKDGLLADGEEKIELNGVIDHPTAEELVASVPSEGSVLRDDLEASPRTEMVQTNAQAAKANPKEGLIDGPSDTSEKKVALYKAQPDLQNENPHNTHTVQSDESQQVVDFGKGSDTVKIPQEVEEKDEYVLAEALTLLRELVSEQRSQKPDQPFELSQREQSKLVEATKLLRSIDFEDISAGTDSFMDIFDGSKLVRQNDNGIVHPLKQKSNMRTNFKVLKKPN